MAKTALITGGSRGIGYATASLLASHGWNVSLCSRNAEQAKKAAAKIAAETSNKNVLGIGADLRDDQAVEKLFAETLSRFPVIDALVNNAAVLVVERFPDFNNQAFGDMMNVNLGGTIRCCRKAFTHMKPRGGSIVNVSSLAGIPGTEKFPEIWGYSVSKFGIVGLTEAIAPEGRPYGIRINCVAPGAVDTDMLHSAWPEVKGADPGEIAKVIYYLCDKDQSGILTGTTIPIFCN